MCCAFTFLGGFVRENSLGGKISQDPNRILIDPTGSCPRILKHPMKDPIGSCRILQDPVLDPIGSYRVL